MRQNATVAILRYYYNVHLKRFKLAMKNLFTQVALICQLSYMYSLT